MQAHARGAFMDDVWMSKCCVLQHGWHVEDGVRRVACGVESEAL